MRTNFGSLVGVSIIFMWKTRGCHDVSHALRKAIARQLYRGLFVDQEKLKRVFSSYLLLPDTQVDKAITQNIGARQQILTMNLMTQKFVTQLHQLMPHRNTDTRTSWDQQRFRRFQLSQDMSSASDTINRPTCGCHQYRFISAGYQSCKRNDLFCDFLW